MRKEKTPKKRRHTELLLGAHDVIHDANKHAKVSTAWMYMNIYIYIIIYIIIYIHINIILYYNILYYTILYYIILYYTILYYITFFLFILYTYTHIQSYTHIQNIYIYICTYKYIHHVYTTKPIRWASTCCRGWVSQNFFISGEAESWLAPAEGWPVIIYMGMGQYL